MEKNEYINDKSNIIEETFKGIPPHLFKYGIPEMLFENDDVITRIINGVHYRNGTSFEEIAHQKEMLLTETDFIRTTGFIIVTTIEEKINLFFSMIDTDGNGTLSWDEVN